MKYTFLQFEYSPWLIVLCLVVSALGTYLLYSKDSNWGRGLKHLLITIRFVALFLLSILLLGPIINQINNTIEKPAWVIGIDNSSSITEVLDSASITDLLNQTNKLKSILEDEDYMVALRTLSSREEVSTSSISFDGSTTNISGFLKNVESDYEGRNLAGVILVSDGIYNRGLSPLFTNYTFPIHTIGIGDTIPKNDLFVQDLKYNKISYQGNSFPIVANIGNKGFEGKANVILSHRGRVLESKEIILSPKQPITQVIFQTEATESGLRKFKIETTKGAGEENTTNNYRHAYVDIVDGKERILLVAAAPHPDIKAISASITTRKNYEVITYIPSIHKEKPVGKFDLIIYHQLPSRSAISKQLIKDYPPGDIPYLLIAGTRSDFRQIGNTLGYISINKLSNENDEVTASFNKDFTYFTLSEELQKILNQLPPLEVPFSDIVVSANASPLLYQRLGTVVTQKPLLLINGTSDVRNGLLLGEGLWRWKLHEYNQNGNNTGFDELILKLVQYLATKADKRKFKCNPIQNEITTNQALKFETEVYNELYELIYGQAIDLALIDESGEAQNYSFTNIEGNNIYKIDGLTSGIYQYKATTNINNTSHSVRGELVVSDQQIENLNTTADHLLLQQLAKKNKGAFYNGVEFPSVEQLSPEKHQGIIHSSESFSSLINFEWLFFLFLILLSVEWFARKYSGSY